MKKTTILGRAAKAAALALLAASFCLASGSAAAGTLAGVPMKDHHLKAFGKDAACETCHGVKTPTARPDAKACIKCHGEMSQIPTKPNPYGKFPHASAHYGDTLECTVCHAEHKASRALCNDCHVVEFPNLK